MFPSLREPSFTFHKRSFFSSLNSVDHKKIQGTDQEQIKQWQLMHTSFIGSEVVPVLFIVDKANGIKNKYEGANGNE